MREPVMLNERVFEIKNSFVALHDLKHIGQSRRIIIRQSFDYVSKCHIHTSESPKFRII